jgi:malonyl-CoA/methylmalonyl-CoA synthetase
MRQKVADAGATNLFERLRARSPRGADAVFLEDPDGGATTTFAELDDETGRLAALLAELGAGPGERVAALVEKSRAAVSLYLACLRAGAVFVPMNPALTAAEAASRLADAEPRVLVCDPAREAELAPAAAAAGARHVLTLDAAGAGTLARFRERPPAAGAAPGGADAPAVILYTSGTTGRPKGALLTHGNLAANAEALTRAWRITADDVLLHALPIFHAHGLFVALHTVMLAGARATFLRRFDAARVAQLLPRASVYMGVPTHYTRLLAVPGFGRAACAGVRLFVSGSAPLLPGTHRAFEAQTGHRILERYGMTETGMITSNPLDGERVPGSVGFALPGIEVRVADAAGAELPRGETGVLEVRGPNVFPGYWRLPERTREEFRSGGWFVTCDLAVMDAAGRVRLVGRAKDLVISGGMNVQPAEVEAALDAVPGVLESAVIGLPHPDLGEGVTAVVVPDGSRPLDEATVLAGIADRLARYKQPRRVLFADALPRNAMGKVEKPVLRERFARTYD